jgi:hypothetical protein
MESHVILSSGVRALGAVRAPRQGRYRDGRDDTPNQSSLLSSLTSARPHRASLPTGTIGTVVLAIHRGAGCALLAPSDCSDWRYRSKAVGIKTVLASGILDGFGALPYLEGVQSFASILLTVALAKQTKTMNARFVKSAP